MATYTFYQDIKCTIWQKQTFAVEASSKEEAIEIAKGYSDKDVHGHFDLVDTVTLDETTEMMTPAENNGASTIEVYDKETRRCIGCNGDDSSFIEQQA